MHRGCIYPTLSYDANVIEHLCPVEGWGSDVVVEGSQAGEIQAGSLQALAYAAGELHAREHLQQVASVASVAVRALGTQPHPCQGCVRGMMGYPPQRPRGQLAEVSTWPNQRSLSSV